MALEGLEWGLGGPWMGPERGLEQGRLCFMFGSRLYPHHSNVGETARGMASLREATPGGGAQPQAAVGVGHDTPLGPSAVRDGWGVSPWGSTHCSTSTHPSSPSGMGSFLQGDAQTALGTPERAGGLDLDASLLHVSRRVVGARSRARSMLRAWRGARRMDAESSAVCVECNGIRVRACVPCVASGR